MYETVNVLGAIRADFVPQCSADIMKASRAGLINFSPSFFYVLSAIFGIQITSSRETQEFIN